MVGLFVVSFMLFCNTQTNGTTYKNNFTAKTITITINKGGQVIIGRDTLTLDQLTDELQKRLWKSYLGTGKMYDSVHLEFIGVVQAALIKSVKEAVKEAEKKTLIDVCLQKHKKLFEDLSSRQQEKIEKQFPVLFAKDY